MLLSHFVAFPASYYRTCKMRAEAPVVLEESCLIWAIYHAGALAFLRGDNLRHCHHSPASFKSA
jgi:hypothetical protein